jgi:DNA repair ATPase RecN
MLEAQEMLNNLSYVSEMINSMKMYLVDTVEKAWDQDMSSNNDVDIAEDLEDMQNTVNELSTRLEEVMDELENYSENSGYVS